MFGCFGKKKPAKDAPRVFRSSSLGKWAPKPVTIDPESIGKPCTARVPPGLTYRGKKSKKKSRAQVKG
jgi:hypothetical protein